MSFMARVQALASAARRPFGPLFTRPDWFAKVTANTLRQDAFAGLTGATIVLPQGIAFAAIAGLPAEYGFYTAMVPPIVAAFLGSSWHAVSGPTTAISAIVFGTLSGLYEVGSPAFIEAAIILALFVGVIQFVLGVVRLGSLVNFVSHSVMVGFITAAAFLILFSQLRHAFALDLPRPEHLVTFFGALASQIWQVDPAAAGIAAATLAVAIAVRAYRPSWPNYLIALAVGTGLLAVMGTAGSHVATIGSIDAVIPNFQLPALTAAHVRDLASPAFAIALVGLLEAMSISRGIAMKSGQQVDTNREFVGQGASNIVGSLFNCYPSSASFTRSGLNYESGAQTPLSAVFAVLFLFVILLFVSPVFVLVPIPAMAGVIIVVAWKLIDLGRIRHILQSSRSEAAVAGITFLVALFVELEFAIYCGVILSILVFLDRSSHPYLSIGAPDPSQPRHPFRPAFANNLAQCPQMMSVGLDGPLYFGSVEAVRRKFREFEALYPAQKNMIFVIRGVGQLDLPAAELLIDEAKRRRARGGELCVQTKIARTIEQLDRYGATRHFGSKGVHLSKGDAIAYLVPRLDDRICAGCHLRIFAECNGHSKPEKQS
ncbi:MAG: SulP family inorganic anion transporter [Yoonia sp.]|uniref:SulP family inorganic anion transporter n=1 Tax=Yoonia sp. TaxID=2212373 RepID=UPI003EFA3F37